jgi:hypothetical protein
MGTGGHFLSGLVATSSLLFVDMLPWTGGFCFLACGLVQIHISSLSLSLSISDLSGILATAEIVRDATDIFALVVGAILRIACLVAALLFSLEETGAHFASRPAATVFVPDMLVTGGILRETTDVFTSLEGVI